MNRENTAAVRRLKAAFAAFTKEVQSVLTELEHANNAHICTLPEVQRIMKLVSDYYSISPEMLVQRNRQAHVAWARQVAIYLSMKHTRYADLQIGQCFVRERTNIIHAVKAVTNRMQTDKKAKADVEALQAKL